MAEGRSNAAIATALVVSDGAVEKHVSNIFTKLDLPPTDTTTGACSPSCAGWRPDMSRPSRTAWLLGGSLFSVAAIGFGTLNLVDLVAHAQSHVHREFAGTVRTLDVDTDGGTIRIEGTDGATATIDANVSQGLRRGHHDEQLQGDRLVVRATCPGFLSQWCGVDYTIRVPRDVAVVATSSDSSIVVTGIDGDVELHSSDGGVTAGDLRSPTRHRVLRRRPRAAHLRHRTDAGPRHLERRRRDRRRARHARFLPGRGVVIGRRHGRRVRTDPSGTRVIDAHSSDGRVTVRYP